VTTLHVLFRKYTPAHVQKMATGKVIATALRTGSMVRLDLPLLIYRMRNWSVHGSAVDSNFRSVWRLKHYINTVLSALIDAHLAIAQLLLSKV